MIDMAAARITAATMVVGAVIAVVIADIAAMVVAEIMDMGAIAVMTGVVGDTTVAGVVAVEDMVVTDLIYLITHRGHRC